jgi:GcrA cell cycle regulator
MTLLIDGAGKKSGWTEARIIALKALQSAGRSASQIANEIGGVSRSGVIGKLFRMGIKSTRQKGYSGFLKPERKPLVPAKRSNRLEFSKIQRRIPGEKMESRVERDIRVTAFRDRFKAEAVQATDLSPEQSATVVTLLEAKNHHCRWPLGDPKEGGNLRFCGANKFENYVYCQRHCMIAYRSPST